MLACTRTAISARAWLVSTTSPSIPAVRRPVLRCVTCRTLTSVLAQLRSLSFCSLLARPQSPSSTPLHIPPPTPPPSPPCPHRPAWHYPRLHGGPGRGFRLPHA